MPNFWDHLPNAKYIDAIIASVVAYPNDWSAAWDAARNASWHAAWDAARNAVMGVSRDAVMGVSRDATWDAAWNAARHAAMGAAIAAVRDAIRALIAWDDCAYMLDSDPGELAIIAAFGDHRAVLLLPACKTLAAIKEKENA